MCGVTRIEKNTLSSFSRLTAAFSQLRMVLSVVLQSGSRRFGRSVAI